MANRLVDLTFDAVSPRVLTRFWADLLGWRSSGETEVTPPATDGCEFGLAFSQASEAKKGKNRLHLDLASGTPEDQASIVDKAISLGARHLDIGQGDVPWVVLSDPEGNEFCVLEPREMYRDAGALAALVVDANEPEVLAAFWAAASGWPIERGYPEIVSLHSPSGRGPWLEFLRSQDAKAGKNRLRPEIRADEASGAPRLGTGDLTDPEGNEFHVR